MRRDGIVEYSGVVEEVEGQMSRELLVVGEVGEGDLGFRVDGEVVLDDQSCLSRKYYVGEDGHLNGRVVSLDSTISVTILDHIVLEVVEYCNNHFSPLILRFFHQVEFSKLLSPGFLVQYVLYTTILYFFSSHIPFPSESSPGNTYITGINSMTPILSVHIRRL